MTIHRLSYRETAAITAPTDRAYRETAGIPAPTDRAYRETAGIPAPMDRACQETRIIPAPTVCCLAEASMALATRAARTRPVPAASPKLHPRSLRRTRPPPRC